MGVFPAAHGGDVSKTSRSTRTYARVHYNICVVCKAQRMGVKTPVLTDERGADKAKPRKSLHEAV